MRNNLKQYNQSNPFVIIINNVREELQTKIVQFTRVGLVGGTVTIGIDVLLVLLITLTHQEARYGALLGFITIWTLFAIIFPLEMLLQIVRSREVIDTDQALDSASTSEVLIMNNEKLYELTRQLERVIGRLEFARMLYLLAAVLFGLLSSIILYLFL